MGYAEMCDCRQMSGQDGKIEVWVPLHYPLLVGESEHSEAHTAAQARMRSRVRQENKSFWHKGWQKARRYEQGKQPQSEGQTFVVQDAHLEASPEDELQQRAPIALSRACQAKNVGMPHHSTLKN